MKNAYHSILGLILVSVCVESLNAQGLKPLQPSQFSSRSLHSEPSENSPILREIENEDQITILRSQSDWYELDVQTKEQLNFKGWLQGTLAPERALPPAEVEVKKQEDPRPLASEKYIWFWDRKSSNTANFDIHLGGQLIFYTLKGGQPTTQNTIYDYDFSGFSIGMGAGLPILKTKLWDSDFFWTLEASYFYGLYGLSFGSDFSVPELQGVGYRIDTHTYRAQSIAKYRLLNNETCTIDAGLGLGFYSHEVAPDLQPIRGGTYAGQIVFAETAIQSISIPLQFNTKFSRDWIGNLSFTPLLFSSISETGSGAPDFEPSGIPFLLGATFGYQWTDGFATLADFEQLMASGTSDVTGLTRLGSDYNRPEIDLSYFRSTFALRFGF